MTAACDGYTIMTRDCKDPIHIGRLSLTGGGDGSLTLVRSMAEDDEPPFAVAVPAKPFVLMALGAKVLGPAAGIPDAQP